MSARRLFAAIRNLVAPGVRQEEFVIAAIVAKNGVSGEAGFAVRDVLNGADTDGWWFVNPGSFFVFFRAAREGAERADRCRAAVEDLRPQHASLRDLRFGQAEGCLVTQVDRAGRLKAIPSGGAVNDAFRGAYETPGAS